MLRLLVLLLLLANSAYYAWAQGYLMAWGLGPVPQAEPQRIERQIKPEAVRVLSADEAARVAAQAASAAEAPRECLQSPVLTATEADAARKLLATWPAGSWTIEPTVENGRWIVYMGKYPTLDQLNRKKAELRQRRVSYEAPANPELEPGLSLGGYATQDEAARALATLGERGVHTARVVQERPDQRGPALKLTAVDEALRAKLDELKPALSSKPLRPCR